jgi:hypothetical protein
MITDMTYEVACHSYFQYIKCIKIGPIRINITNLIKSETIPVLSIFRILTVLDEYIIAIGGVVEGIALGIEQYLRKRI